MFMVDAARGLMSWDMGISSFALVGVERMDVQVGLHSYLTSSALAWCEDRGLVHWCGGVALMFLLNFELLSGRGRTRPVPRYLPTYRERNGRK